MKDRGIGNSELSEGCVSHGGRAGNRDLLGLQHGFSELLETGGAGVSRECAGQIAHFCRRVRSDVEMMKPLDDLDEDVVVLRCERRKSLVPANLRAVIVADDEEE